MSPEIRPVPAARGPAVTLPSPTGPLLAAAALTATALLLGPTLRERRPARSVA
ncbi:hypothetical protein ACIQF6_20905 [Kitasatospora sp. NPDC092948]|uniref:hypothetical protein n=1 Tax=Kitasatospora sp. NPDC092948 TaxID=3364088 RepID=UPI00382D5437